MNRIVKTALAIAVAGPAVHAGTGDNEWAALDSEISGLASSLQPSQQDGMGWAVLLRSVYSFASDDISTGVGGSDTSGFNFNDVDIAFWGNHGPYIWRINADIDNNEAGNFIPGAGSQTDLVLEDAFVRVNCGEYFDVTMGQFKPRITRTNSVDPENLLFIDRTVLGSAFDSWDNGIGASGAWEQLNWYLAIMNGFNGHVRDHFYLARVEWNFGTGAGMYEGAVGSSDSLNGTIGFSFLADDTIGDLTGDGDSDNTAFVLDFHGSVSNFGFGAEVANFDDDFAALTDEDYGNIVDSGDGMILIPGLVLAPDSTPWAVYGSYLISPEWEVGVRYEDLDNGDSGGPDNTVLTFGANWYRNGGAGKWQAQYTMVDADGAFNDGDYLEIGYAIGHTR